MLDHAVARATEILRAAGAYDVWHELPIPEGGWHLMGTAPMGADPARSVVDEWGRNHDLKNLFIVDGSIFAERRRERYRGRRSFVRTPRCYRSVG
jgi:choline dehydrogenase-like flavoprotein